MYAVISASGRQYRVASGDLVTLDRMKASEGDEVSFPAVLVVDGDAVKARPGDLDGVVVKGTVVGHGRAKKIRVFNYHAKTGWKKARGHRQDQTTVRITEIG